MSIATKKLASIALTVSTVLWAAGVASLPLANAQTTADLQAQIAALLSQIQQLQAQLGTSSSSTTTTTSCYPFSSDLTVGSTGAAVTALQKVLIAKGYLTAVSAPTGYFGALTKTAVGKWQAANGVSPTAGYFGPKSRAFYASTCVGTTTTTTTTGTGTGTGTVTPPAVGLGVSLASDNPSTGSLISSANSGSARVPVLAVNLTASNSGAVTVTGINFHKTGVLSDSSISGAYLTHNGQVVAQYNSISNGVISFSGMSLSIPAGQTMEYQLAIDTAGGLSAGNTTGFSLSSASDVTAWNSANTAVTPTGSFPLNGNTFTVTTVTSPSLATLAITSSSIGTTVTAGTQGNIVGAYTFNVANNKVYLKSLNFHVIGSANKGDIRNVKLLVNGTQVGNTLATVGQDGTAYFDLSSNPGILNTGNNNVQIVADVMGSPSYYFQFELLNGYDVYAVDRQYNVPISVTNKGGAGTQVGIQQGQITVNQDLNTPSGNIAKGQSQVILAKYDIYAAGEAVKVKYLDFNIQLTGLASGAKLSDQIQNVSLTDDAGNQVGSSINQPPSSLVCAAGVPDANLTVTAAGNATASSTGNVTYADCFGSSGSNINYVIPANTTRVLSLKADVQSTATFSSIAANLSGNTSNLQGMISSQIGSSSGVNGVALTLVNSSLTVSQNNALGTQNVSAGTQGVKIGSYTFGASSAEGANVNTLSIRLTDGTTTAAFQNLKVIVNGAQFGTTQGVVSGNTTYSFSGTAFNVPKGGSANVDVYADTLSNATGTFSPATTLEGYSGVGQISYTSLPGSTFTAIPGQVVSFNGQPALTISADSSNPPSGQIVQGLTGNPLAVFRFAETSNVEAVKVTQLDVLDAVASSGVVAAFSNLQLVNGTTVYGTVSGAPTYDATQGGYVYHFTSFSTPLVINAGQSLSLTLKGDAGTMNAGSISDNTTSTFEIATTTPILARGNTSNKTAVVTLSSAAGNPQTILRTTMIVAGATVVPASPSLAQIGTVTFTANNSGDAQLSSLMLTFGGNAMTYATSSFLNTVVLKNSSGNNIAPLNATTTQTATTKTWTFSTSTPIVVSAGQAYTLQLWGDTSQFPAQGNIAQSLSASISGASDFQYLDATNNSPATVSLPTNLVPITITALSGGVDRLSFWQLVTAGSETKNPPFGGFLVGVMASVVKPAHAAQQSCGGAHICYTY